MTKVISKAQATIIRDAGYPKFYLKALVDLEAFLTKSTSDKDAKKSMNAVNAKAFTAMKQKIRKTHKSLESQIEAWRANPTEDASEAESEEESESEQEELSGRSRFLKSTSTDEESSEVESDEDAPKGVSRWAKSATKTSDKKTVAKKDKVVRPKQLASESEDDDGFTKVGASDKSQQAKADLVISSETLHTRLCEVLEARGKKATDRGEQIDILIKLLPVAKTPIHKIKVLLTLISSRFDLNQNMNAAQSIDMWKSAETEINQVFDILEQNELIVLSELGEGWEEDREYRAGEQYAIRGNIVSLISRLNDEFTKSLQNMDPHTMDYIDRLKDEVTLYALIVRGQNYCQSKKETENITFLQIMRLEHIYFKYNNVTKLFEEKIRGTNSSLGPAPTDIDLLVRDMCVSLYKNAPDRVRTRAVLCHVYHHALHKRFYEARDLLLMSHLPETIHQTDVPTQVLYNRALVQIGICAFRMGLIKESHHALNDIMGSLKAKDILAQGTQLAKYQTAETERKEKHRMLPFHMHINMEMLEAIQLIVSMLLEIPNMAAYPYDTRRKLISKHFRRLYEQSEQQVFRGPAESFKDQILQAARALSEGNWKQCRDLVCGLKPLDLLPEAPIIRDMLAKKFQIEGLRTYLFAFGQYYQTMSMQALADQFELPKSAVASTLAKMIVSDELSASVDETTGMITLRHNEPTRAEYLALQFAEKLNSLVEANESLLELKSQPLLKKQTKSTTSAQSGAVSTAVAK